MAASNKRITYISARDWAQKLGVSITRARQLLEERGAEFGARRRIHGRLVLWEVPENLEDPRMARGRPKKVVEAQLSASRNNGVIRRGVRNLQKERNYMKNLTRYDLVDGEYLSKEMSTSLCGEWVKFSDIKELLQTSHNKQSKTVTIACTCGKRSATVHLCEQCFEDAVTA